MCTVTFIPLGGDGIPDGGNRDGYRVACNRDESPLRAAGLPPQMRRFGEQQALLPIDPVAGGTWIAANDTGLTGVLLNAHPRAMIAAPAIDMVRPTPATNLLSRGTIIPRLLGCGELDEAVAQALLFDAGQYGPFRLLIADATQVAELAIDEHGRLTARRHRLDRPLMFTSSGLGDGIVDEPRRRLFDEMFAADRAAWPMRQDAYQRHAWPDRPQVSVCMRRDEARTVSLTVVEVGRDAVTMDYYGAAPDRAASPVTAELPHVRIANR